MKSHLRTLGLAAAHAAAVLTLAASSVHAQSILRYDINNVRLSGFGSFTHVYTGGMITSLGGGLAAYTGGIGSLNDGVTAVGQNGNMLFQASDNTVITLFLSGSTKLSSFTVFGGLFPAANILPGTLTGATIKFGGLQAILASTPSGGACFSGQCDDTFNFAGTVFDGVTGSTIEFSNFLGGFTQSGERFFNASEFSIVAAQSTVPEPSSFALMLVGGALVTVVSKRRQRTRA